MDFLDFKELLPSHGLFRSNAPELLEHYASAHTFQQQLGRWVRAQKIHQLRRGLYSVNNPAQQPQPFFIAQYLHPGSIISMQSALDYWGLMKSPPQEIISITTDHHERLENHFGVFHFFQTKFHSSTKSIPIELAPGQIVAIAAPEHALLELFYHTPDIRHAIKTKSLNIQRPIDLPKFSSAVMELLETISDETLHRALLLQLGIWRMEEKNGEQVIPDDLETMLEQQMQILEQRVSTDAHASSRKLRSKYP